MTQMNGVDDSKPKSKDFVLMSKEDNRTVIRGVEAPNKVKYFEDKYNAVHVKNSLFMIDGIQYIIMSEAWYEKSWNPDRDGKSDKIDWDQVKALYSGGNGGKVVESNL